LIENTSSIGIRNGLSISRTGVGMYSSTTRISSQMHSYSGASISLLGDINAFNALPRTIGVSSPGNS
jgi:hypothetical protein